MLRVNTDSRWQTGLAQRQSYCRVRAWWSLRVDEIGIGGSRESFESEIDQEPNVGNRMPTSDEMRLRDSDIIRPNRKRFAGMIWYVFRNPTNEYKQAVLTDRTDPNGGDRWQAL